MSTAPQTPSVHDRISILMKEYERVCTDTRGVESINEKLMTLGLTVIGAGFSYGLVSGKAEIFVILPVIFLGVLFYGSLNYYYIFFFGGYKRFLEERINSLAKEPLLLWEAVVSKRSHPTFISVSLACLYTFLFIGMVAIGIDRILTTNLFETNQYLPWYFLAVIVSMLALLLLSIRNMQRASGQAHEWSMGLYENGVKYQQAEAERENPNNELGSRDD